MPRDEPRDRDGGSPEAAEPLDDPERLGDLRFGTVAVWSGYVSVEALAVAVKEQVDARRAGKRSKRIGGLLRDRGHLTDDQIRRILKVQLQRLPAEGRPLFGEIAVAHRFISPEERRRALDVQSREILAGGRVRHISEILVEMGAMDREAADAVTAYQAEGDSTPMSRTRKARVESERSSVDRHGGAGPPAPQTPEPREEEPGPAPKPPEAPRPAFLPRGALGFVSDHSTWLVIAAAAVLAIALVAFKERVFGAREAPPTEEALSGNPRP